MKRLGLRAVIWTLPAASAIHHTEELLLSRDQFPVPDDVVARWRPPWLRLLIPTTYRGSIAWSALEVIVVTAVTASAAREEPPGWATRLFGFTTLLGAIDVTDHAALLITRQTYNAGLASSTIRLMHSLWTLHRLVEARRIDRRWLRRVLWITAPLPVLTLALPVVARVIRPLLPPEGDAIDETSGRE